jgi:polar amino acid transport system substrate-binding protein
MRAFVAAFVVVVLAAMGARAEDALDRALARGTLVIVVEPETPPIASRDSSGALVGLDVDVGKEIARRLGLTATIEAASWSAIVDTPWTGTWDVALASITPTAERRARLGFPAVYRMAAAVLVVPATNTAVQAPADAAGARIGVLGSTTYETYLRTGQGVDGGTVAATIADPVVVTFPTEAEGLLELLLAAQPDIDAMVTDIAVAEHGRRRGLPLRVVPSLLYVEPIAVAVAKGEDRLGERIAEVVEAMREDGTIGRLTTQWLGLDLTP